MPIPITVWPGVRKLTSFSEAQLTKNDIEDPQVFPDKGSMRLISMARFGNKTNQAGALRLKENVIARTGQELDYDGDDGRFPAITEVLSKLKASGLTCHFYTSPSYSDSTAKWRVLLPFKREVTGTPEELEAHAKGCVMFMEDLLGVKFKADSWRIEQSYYIGRVDGATYHGETIAGSRTLDQVEDLPVYIWKAEQISGQKIDEAVVTGDLLEGTNYHESLLSLAGKYIAGGMSKDMVITALEGAMDKAEQREGWQSRRDEIPRIVDYCWDKEQSKPRKEKTKQAPVADAPIGFAPVTFEELTSELPEPEWLLEGLMNTRGPIMISGIGSTGKSMLTMQLAFSLAEGWPIFGYTVPEPCTVFIINAEDSRLKFLRRAQSYMDHMGITADSGRVIYWGRDSGSYEVQLSNEDGVNEEWVSRLQEVLARTPGRKVLILDPLSQFAQGEENSNEDATQYRIATYKLADEVDECSVIDIHHEKKAYGFEDGSKSRQGGHSGRGAGGFSDRARATFNLRYTDEQELQDLGFPVDTMQAYERRRFVTLDHTKPDEGEIRPPIHLERGEGGILSLMSGPDYDTTLDFLIMELGDDWLQFCRNVVGKIRTGSMPAAREMLRSKWQREQVMPGGDYSQKLFERWVEAGVEARFFTAERGFKMGEKTVPSAT